MDLRAQFDRLIGPLRRRVLLMIGRAVVRVVDDSLKLQAVQVEGLPGEVLDGIERWQQYGFTSVPHPGAEAIIAALGGQRQHSVVLAVEDRRYRVMGLEQGEVCIYTDEDDSDLHRITLGRGRVIRLEAGGLSLVLDGAMDTAILTAGGGVEVHVDDGENVFVGGTAGEELVTKTMLETYYNTHTHSTPSGPSGPPLIASPVVPGNDLTEKLTLGVSPCP